MTKRLIISQGEKITPDDLTGIGVYGTETSSNIVGDALGYPQHYAAVTISEQSATTVTINPGRLFVGSGLYDLDEPFNLDLMQRLPTVTGDTVWIALLLRGEEVTDYDLVTVEIDVDTGQTDLQSLPKTNRLTVTCIEQAGIPGPTPLKPSVASHECVVAWVLLSNTGIETIEMNPDHRVKTLYEVEGRVTILETRVDVLEQTAATLRTDISAIAASQRDAVRPEIFNQVRLDVSALRRQQRLFENDPRASVYDPALVKDIWDEQNSLWLARIAEGIRFPFASYRDSQLRLLNPVDPNVMVYDNLVLPKYSEEIVSYSWGGKQSRNISQQVHTEVTAVRREVARSAVVYGPTYQVCENQADWNSASGGNLAARVGSTLAVAGETFQVVGQSKSGAGGSWNANPASGGHKNYDVRAMSTTTWTEVYWDYVTETFGLNGSVVGQTWLNSQAAIATGIYLNFTRVGSDGDVHLVLCECSATGRPMIDRTIAKSAVVHADLKKGRVKFPFRPSLLEQGKRYSWFVVTTGNHAIAYSVDNKFAEGSSWLMTDGAWAIGSPTDDYDFEVARAKFASTVTEIEFEPLTLDGGISYIRLVAAGWAPDLTEQLWMWQPQGSTIWYELDPSNADILYGLPPLIRLKLVMVHTTDLAPAILLDSKARGETGRSRGDMRAVTKAIEFGISTTAITVDLMCDAWVEGEHTAEVKLRLDNVETAATATSIWQDPDKPGRRRLTATFSGLAPTTEAVVQVEGLKTGVDEWFGESLFVMAN